MNSIPVFVLHGHPLNMQNPWTLSRCQTEIAIWTPKLSSKNIPLFNAHMASQIYEL